LSPLTEKGEICPFRFCISCIPISSKSKYGVFARFARNFATVLLPTPQGPTITTFIILFVIAYLAPNIFFTRHLTAQRLIDGEMTAKTTSPTIAKKEQPGLLTFVTKTGMNHARLFVSAENAKRLLRIFCRNGYTIPVSA